MSDNNGDARSSFAQQPVLCARNSLAQLTDGPPASSSSDSSDISMRSSASRLGLFLLPLPVELMASRNSLLSILDCSLGADATSARNRRSWYASKARSSYNMVRLPATSRKCKAEGATYVLVVVVKLQPLLLVCRLHECLSQLSGSVTTRLLDLGEEGLGLGDLGAFL
jgi:hypothetical protein